MKRRMKVILWSLPIIIIGLELLGLIIICKGLAVPWKFVGKPAQRITQIIGYEYTTRNLYVESESGEIFSLFYSYRGSDSIPLPVQWVKEKDFTLEPAYILTGKCESFSVPPLLTEVKQSYQFIFPSIESCAQTRFAISEDGNLWVWYYESGLCSYLSILAILLIPLEIAIYLIALFVSVVISLVKKSKQSWTGGG